MEQERLWTLLGKKLAGVATGEELQELELLLLAYGEDPGTIGIIERMWASRKNKPATKSADDDDNDPIKNRIGNRLGFLLDAQTLPALPVLPLPVKKTQVWLRPWLIGSAAACITGLVWFGFTHPLRKTGKPAAMNVLFTRKKSHSNLQLPDGTLVVLNQNSRISYNADFGETKREIVLEGEAYFDVAKNTETPMVIHARNVDIHVMGTAFNVKAYPQDKQVETSLFKGAVEVSSSRFPTQKVLLRPNEKIAIAAMDAEFQDEIVLAYNTANLQEEPDSNAISGRPSNTSNHPLPADGAGPAADTLTYHMQPLKVEHTSRLVPEIAWIYRKLVFDHEPFESVAKKMEQFYDVRIYFEDDDLKKEIFTGAFNSQSLEEALKALHYTYPKFSFIIKKNEVFIKRK